MMTATSADVITWLDNDDVTIDAALLDRVFASAVGALEDDYDLDAAQADRANQAVCMLTARLIRRRYSINGVESANDWGPIRVSISDPDIHNLLKPWELVRFG